MKKWLIIVLSVFGFLVAIIIYNFAGVVSKNYNSSSSLPTTYRDLLVQTINDEPAYSEGMKKNFLQPYENFDTKPTAEMINDALLCFKEKISSDILSAKNNPKDNFLNQNINILNQEDLTRETRRLFDFFSEDVQKIINFCKGKFEAVIFYQDIPKDTFVFDGELITDQFVFGKSNVHTIQNGIFKEYVQFNKSSVTNFSDFNIVDWVVMLYLGDYPCPLSITTDNFIYTQRLLERQAKKIGEIRTILPISPQSTERGETWFFQDSDDFECYYLGGIVLEKDNNNLFFGHRDVYNALFKSTQ